MICFWILKKGYENKKIFGKPALKSFTHLYFEDTGIPHITKVINQDPVNKNDQNFFLVLDSANLYSIIENDKYKKYQKEIDKLKRPQSKETKTKEMREFVGFFKKHLRDISNIFEMQNLLIFAKLERR
jgi:hypothetical protein